MPNLTKGEVFVGCRILDTCGYGGFGTVYLAENAVGRRVAVKIVNTPDKDAELNGIRCYMAAAPRSPYLLPIHHVGIENGELFYIMAAADPLKGHSAFYVADTLGRRLKLDGHLAPETALEIVRKIASAVETLHQAGLIHRDIKPDNIIFVGGEPMLSDPGLLRPVECSASLAGTLGFLPPECFSGEENNSMGGDIYALGKVFYCAITGEPPGRYPHLPRNLGKSVCRKLLPILLKACNEKKERRYADIGEFRRALPEKLPKPGLIERLDEKFRLWRLMHWRLWNSILAAAAALVVLGGICAYRTVECRRRAALEHAEMERAAANLRKRFADGGIRLRLQLVRALGEAEAKALLGAAEKLPKRPAEALAYCSGVEKRLRGAAEKLIGAAWKIGDPLRRSGELRSLLDSPLGECLAEAERKKLGSDLAADEKKHDLVRPWYPSPGRTYYPDSSRKFEFAYVPPGEFVSPRTKKTLRIDYPLWVGITELTVQQFFAHSKFIPSGNRDLDLPVTCVLWNDLLFACELQTLFFLNCYRLPPGYIVRPLTENEWEYCALAGMRSVSPDGADGGEKAANNGPARPGIRPPNAFGLYDIPGNIRESVLSDEHGNAGSYVIRDGSWLTNPRKRLTSRREVAFYQAFARDIGARFAVAPGTPELYDREFRFREDAHLRYKGVRYELFGHLQAVFSRKDARDICALLGGAAAKLDDPELLRELLKISSPVMRYPIVIDAEFRDGRWRWSDGTALAVDLPAPKPNEVLMVENGKFKLTSYKFGLGFVCRWSDGEWAKRCDLSSPERRRLILAEFELDGSRYVLIRAYLYPHLARRCAEILGGKLAEPKTPEKRRRIAEKLGVHAAIPAFLGGIWKHGRYHWLTDGGIIDGELRLGRESSVADNAPSLMTPALANGELCVVQVARHFLMEFPTAAAK